MQLNSPTPEGYGISRTHNRIDALDDRKYIVAVYRKIERVSGSLVWITEESPIQEMTDQAYRDLVHRAMRLFWDKDNQLRPRSVAEFEAYLHHHSLALWINKKEC
jgi:hypothetical protein